MFRRSQHYRKIPPLHSYCAQYVVKLCLSVQSYYVSNWYNFIFVYIFRIQSG